MMCEQEYLITQCGCYTPEYEEIFTSAGVQQARMCSTEEGTIFTKNRKLS